MKILNIYAGKSKPFGPRGKLSAIHKHAIEHANIINTGIEGDEQGDRKVHGGPEKAIHQYSLAGYEKLMKRYPIHHKLFTVGTLGENLIIDNMTDDSVCIGDIYQMGNTKLQVCAPRIPCWKISHKLDVTDIDKYIGQNGITGWYFRVLENGKLSIGDEVLLLESPNPQLSISRFMTLINHDDTDIEEVKRASKATGLDPEWQRRLEKKIKIRMEKNGDYVL